MTDFGKYILVAVSALIGITSVTTFPTWHESTATTCQAYVNRLSIEALHRPATTSELVRYEGQIYEVKKHTNGMNCTFGYWWTMLHSGQFD